MRKHSLIQTRAQPMAAIALLLSAAPSDSRPNLVRDKISVMNAANLNWTLWTYRDLSPLSFGLYHDTELDETLAAVLHQALVKPSAALYLPLIIGQ